MVHSALPQFSKEPKGASDSTKQANEALRATLPFDDVEDFSDAEEGFLLTWPDLTIPYPSDPDKSVWTLRPYEDQKPGSTCPETVNPSLWRQSTLNRTNGLYRVADGFYQVRAFDMSNMTIIEGKTGLIIIDPLISCECAADALKLYREYTKSTRQVKAVIFTHSHVDHFGGVLGVISPEDVKNGVEVVAPDGFLEHAVSENVYAGIAMGRRAQYMYGPTLKAGMDADNKGQVDAGLGKGQSVGKVSIVAPTLSVSRTGQMVTLDGVDIVFHMTPGAEAPSEFDFYFPKSRLFCAAENAVHTMHNIQTLRGAKVRDALLWSKYLNETLSMFGRETDVLFASHHWPVWDKRGDKTGRVARFLTMQRDMYRYLNDQTLRMLNKGYTGIEIAEVFEMPPALAKEWSCRGYYGTVNHNVKAVYDRYMGWFDGNPSNLHPLPPAESAPRYVEAMGGAKAVIARAYVAYQKGEYRWAAELLNKLIFAEPDNKDAKLLLADVLEQLGYQAEAATWRNFFLMGAKELRDEGPPVPETTSSDSSMMSAMTVEMIFDAIAGKINGPQANADPNPIVMNWIFTDTEEQYLVELSNGALSTTAGKTSTRDDVTVILTRDALDRIMAKETVLARSIEAGDVKVYGDITKLGRLISLLDPGDVGFPIVTPRPNSVDAWRGSGAKPEAREGAKPDPMEALKREVRVLGKLPRGC
jgi:alkyl sulfatase BDS1-like metallo-beta-lactamase superfamily hydrolase